MASPPLSAGSQLVSSQIPKSASKCAQTNEVRMTTFLAENTTPGEVVEEEVKMSTLESINSRVDQLFSLVREQTNTQAEMLDRTDQEAKALVRSQSNMKAAFTAFMADITEAKEAIFQSLENIEKSVNVGFTETRGTFSSQFEKLNENNETLLSKLDKFEKLLSEHSSKIMSFESLVNQSITDAKSNTTSILTEFTNECGNIKVKQLSLERKIKDLEKKLGSTCPNCEGRASSEHVLLSKLNSLQRQVKAMQQIMDERVKRRKKRMKDLEESESLDPKLVVKKLKEDIIKEYNDA